jgi:hypothetical protein
MLVDKSLNEPGIVKHTTRFVLSKYERKKMEIEDNILFQEVFKLSSKFILSAAKFTSG